MSDHRALCKLFAARIAALGAALVLLNLATTVAAQSPAAAVSHPRHDISVWSTHYKNRTFHVVRLPRCEHLQAVISHEPGGETRARAKQRLGGVASLTGSFHDPRTYWLADFLQRDGNIVSGASTGRWFLVMRPDGTLDISGDYASYKGKPGVSAIALGQRLVPLHRDGFSVAFMNRTTQRMAIGLNADSVYLVEATTDIWRLAAFMQSQLHVTVALNSDGGHVVYGRAPVHLVFRWRPSAETAVLTPASPSLLGTEPLPSALAPGHTQLMDDPLLRGEADTLSLRPISTHPSRDARPQPGEAEAALLPAELVPVTNDGPRRKG